MENSGTFGHENHLTVEQLLAALQLGRTLDVRPVKACARGPPTLVLAYKSSPQQAWSTASQADGTTPLHRRVELRP